MSGAYAVAMGDRGRLVVPQELRERAGFTEGAELILVETDTGVVMMTRDQARVALREQLQGTDLVAELLEERLRAARNEDGEV